MDDGSSTFFFDGISLLVGGPLNVRFRRFHDLAEYKLSTVAEMNSLGLSVGGDAWK